MTASQSDFATRQAFHEAVAADDLAKVQTMLSAGVSAEACVSGETALYVAATQASIDMINLLVEGGANPNTQLLGDDYPNHYRTALIGAAVSRRLDSMNRLLDMGADPTAVSSKKRNAGHMLATFATAHPDRSTELVSMYHRLVESGLAIDAQDERGSTILHMAASADSPPWLVSALLELGANPHLLDNTGQSPVHIACKNDTDNVLQTFVDHGVALDSPNVNNDTALHLCVHMSKLQMIEPLFPDLDVQNRFGCSALTGTLHTLAFQATKSDQLMEKARWLITLGAGVDVADTDGITARSLIRDVPFPEFAAMLASRAAREAISAVVGKPRPGTGRHLLN